MSRKPRTTAEIGRRAEAEALDWAQWLAPYIDTGIRWILEARYGEVPTENHGQTTYIVDATPSGVRISIVSGVGPRIAKLLKGMNYNVTQDVSNNKRYDIWIEPHKK